MLNRVNDPPALVADAIHVNGDRTRLVQVLVNLLNNAAKYTPLDGTITLAVAVAVQGQSVEIAVTDNGIGIDRALLPHVFELFTQAERTPDRSQGGLGIGLALVRNMVALHGGSVTASSPGQAGRTGAGDAAPESEAGPGTSEPFGHGR